MIDLSANRLDLSPDGVTPFDTIVGTPGDDSLAGTTAADLIQGLGGADTLDGGKGDDTIEGGDGDDVIFGGKGHDLLSGGVGADFIHAASDGTGDDTSADTLDGGDGDDVLFGSHQADSIDGGIGADAIFTYGGADTVHAGDGDDSIGPSAGPPLTFCDGGEFYGEAGDDFIAVASPAVKHSPGGTISGGDGEDQIQFRAFAASDWLLEGGAGHDEFLVVGRGADTIDGGDGRDLVNYRSAGKALVIDLLAGTATGATVGQDSLIGIEDVDASRGADSMSGDGNDNQFHGRGGSDALAGSGGDDALFGNGGADQLSGGEGSDTMNGGGGADLFIYYSVGESVAADPDQIANLHKSDQIDLSAIDADITQDGDQAFVRVSVFGGHAGELVLVYDSGAGRTYLEGDVDGDGNADLMVELIGDHAGFTGLIL